MRLSISIFCLAILQIATTNPLSYEILDTNMDNLNLDTGNVNLDNAQFLTQPTQPQGVIVAEGGDENEAQGNTQNASKIFCDDGFLRACCIYKMGRLDRNSGLHHYQCMGIANGKILSGPPAELIMRACFPKLTRKFVLENEVCDTEYGNNYTPRHPVMEKGGDLCCRDDESSRTSNTGDLLCKGPQTAQETVRDTQRGNVDSGTGSIRVAPWGQ